MSAFRPESRVRYPVDWREVADADTETARLRVNGTDPVAVASLRGGQAGVDALLAEVVAALAGLFPRLGAYCRCRRCETRRGSAGGGR